MNQAATTAEEILIISSDEEGAVEKEKARLLRKYVQEIPWKGYQVYLGLNSHNELLVQKRIKGRRQPSKYRVALPFIDPTPHSFRVIARSWFKVGAILTALSVMFWLLAGFDLLAGYRAYGFISAVLIGTLALITLLVGLQRSKKRLRLHTLHGDLPLVELVPNMPDKTTFERLMKEIRHLHLRGRKEMAERNANLLALELNEHRRLHQEGTLSGEAYELAKRNIMRHYS